MLPEGLALKLRPRTYMEAGDLGVRLCQHARRSVYRCYLPLLLPTAALSLTLLPLGPRVAFLLPPGMLPMLLLWWLKPWLDRPVLFAVSRAAFGEEVAFAQLWRQRGTVLFRGLVAALTWRRLSPWRAFTAPAGLLEQKLPGAARARRMRSLLGPRFLVPGALTLLFALTELVLCLSLLMLVYYLAPHGYAPDLDELFASNPPGWVGPMFTAGYTAVLALTEPFYVAAGFGMYINRRVELEAWDLEKELRRAFPA